MLVQKYLTNSIFHGEVKVTLWGLLVYELNDGGGGDGDELCLYHLKTILMSGRN